MKAIYIDTTLVKYLSLEKLKQLHDVLGFLDTYLLNENESHFITSDKEGTLIDLNKTQALYTLGKLNKEREELIKTLLDG